MKLAISNIAFEAKDDEFIYEQMRDLGFSGLEIAPTRIIPERPYDRLDEAKSFAAWLKKNYGLEIVSMQSIWFGITQKIFSSPEERAFLVDYTKKAVDFAEAVGCKNLVFGCPRNRVVESEGDYATAVEFFKTLGDYAAAHSTVIAIEANPPIYNTNFINNDEQALKLYGDVASDGFKINLDMGTMIHNSEEPASLDFSAISHVHLSEPGLVEIERRPLHTQLCKIMKDCNYGGWVSVEMKKGLSREGLINTMKYAKEVFG